MNDHAPNYTKRWNLVKGIIIAGLRRENGLGESLSKKDEVMDAGKEAPFVSW